MTDTATARAADENAYSGFFGAYRYAFGASDSTLFRTYALASAFLGLALTVLFAFTLTVWFVSTLGQSALTTASNAFLGVIALFVLGPLFAPVLLVARAHRRGADTDPNYDFLLALAGYAFVVSLYVGLVVTVPPAQQTSTHPIAVALYSVPRLFGVVPPVLAAFSIWVVHRLAG